MSRKNTSPNSQEGSIKGDVKKKYFSQFPGRFYKRGCQEKILLPIPRKVFF
jgi:hypothetical protein